MERRERKERKGKGKGPKENGEAGNRGEGLREIKERDCKS
jgi:hypothetical protein